MNREVRRGLLNLHDAFLNASLMRSRMFKEPLEKDVATFHFTDRARFERLWIALLAVLIEAWHSGKMGPVRQYIASVTNTSQLVTLLRQARGDGRHKKMVECRHYMFHRDKRQFWDDGRIAPVGDLRFHLELHEAFSTVLLSAVKAANAEAKSAQ